MHEPPERSGRLPEHLVYGLDRPCILDPVARQLRNRRLEFLAAHDRQDTLHRFELQELLAADEEVVLGDQSNEIELELAGRGLHAESHVRHVAGDISGDGGMGEFDLLVAIDAGAIEFVLPQELLEEQAGGGIGIAVDEADRWLEQALERGYAQWIAALDHQAHLAGNEADDPMDA